MNKILPRFFSILNYDNFHGKVLSLFVSLFQMADMFVRAPSRNSLSLFKLVLKVKPFYSQLSARRLINLYYLAKKVNDLGVRGDVVECGVWNGGSAAMLAKGLEIENELTTKKIWLFDSFQGLPSPTDKDDSRNNKKYFDGICTGDEKKVEEIFLEMNISSKRIEIVKGWFSETFPKNTIEKISLLHIDTDWYDSIKIVLEYFYQKVSQGGFIVIDDYYTLKGCQAAVNDFLKENQLEDKVNIIKVDWNGAYFCKS
ncbi:MAG: macrocin O-methyltransferase [Candidatus Omnitrophica bacterium]|nr:macrocin O-methyltransferase [Candidatus Omnitrophota bacterium]